MRYTKESLPCLEIPRIPILEKDEWPDVSRVVVGCLAHQGRSIVGHAMIAAAIEEGSLPNFTLSSGAIDTMMVRKYFYKEPNRTVLESLHKRNIYTAPSKSQSLQLASVRRDTDLIAFIPSSVLKHFLQDHLPLNTWPRSVISVPFPDPSDHTNQSMEDAVEDLCDSMNYFVKYQLLGMLHNVRKGLYK